MPTRTPPRPSSSPLRVTTLVFLLGIGVAVVFALRRGGGEGEAEAAVPAPADDPAILRDTVELVRARAVEPATDSVLPSRVVVDREDPGAAEPRSGEPVTTRALMDELGIRIEVGGEHPVILPLESLFLLPGETRTLEARAADGAGFQLVAPHGSATEAGEGRWRWTAPGEPGAYPLHLVHRGSGARVRLHAFVMVPAEEVRNGRLNGYRIGTYPATALRGNPIYLPPAGFVQITPRTRDVKVSPRFRLDDFKTKQGEVFPRYVVLRPALLRKLELVVDALAERGYPVSSFHVMSGYRTPYYNVSVLGNVPYSRHQWGGAADVFVDERPRNGRMDDLNGDGRVNVEDARVIHQVVDSLERVPERRFPAGGLGLYRANAVRGPFVHIDVRGAPARW